MKKLIFLTLFSLMAIGMSAQCAKTCASKTAKSASVEKASTATQVASVLLEKKECTPEELAKCKEACKKVCTAKTASTDGTATSVASTDASAKACSEDCKKACCADQTKVAAMRIESESASKAKSCAAKCAAKSKS